MLLSESRLNKQIMVALSQVRSRVFRNNTALAWAGVLFKPQRTMSVSIGPQDVLLRNARPIHAGLCEGSSDLIGWTVVKITTEMIGREIAVFTAVEGKSETGRATAEQKNFVSAVAAAGGIAVIARSVEDVLRGIREFRGS